MIPEKKEAQLDHEIGEGTSILSAQIILGALYTFT